MPRDSAPTPTRRTRKTSEERQIEELLGRAQEAFDKQYPLDKLDPLSHERVLEYFPLAGIAIIPEGTVRKLSSSLAALDQKSAAEKIATAWIEKHQPNSTSRMLLEASYDSDELVADYRATLDECKNTVRLCAELFHPTWLSPEARKKIDEGKAKETLIKSSAEFVAGFVPPDYLIDGLIQRRFVYSLTGPTGSGKTTVMMRIIAHVARGMTVDEREIEKASVLYFAGENPDDVRMRWIKLCEEMGIDPDGMDVFFLPGTPPISNEEIRKRIDEEAAKRGPFGLVVIDTSAAYFQGDDENSNSQLHAHAKMLRTFTDLPGGPAVVVTCHPTKNFDVNNLLPRGGGAFLNEMDGNLVAINRDPIVRLHWHGKFRGPDFTPLLFKLQTGTSDKLVDNKGRRIITVVAAPISEAEEAAMGTAQRESMNSLLLLIADEEGLSLSGMATKLGWDTASGSPNKGLVNRTLKRLVAAGLVESEPGRTALTKKGRTALKTTAEGF